MTAYIIPVITAMCGWYKTRGGSGISKMRNAASKMRNWLCWKPVRNGA